MPYEENGTYVSPIRIRTERIAEWLGPLENFNFEKEAEEQIKSMSPKPTVSQLVNEWKSKLAMAAKPNALATDDGGWPRMWWHKVLRVGMASQWPYWTPRPVVEVAGTYGIQWIDFASITGIRVEVQK